MFVVDASVATKWFVSQIYSDIAERVQNSRRPLLAPQILFAEVADALRKHVRVGDITIGQATDALQALPSCFSEIVASAISRRHPPWKSPESSSTAPTIASILPWRGRQCKLVTADKRFINRIARTRTRRNVVHLADWT